MSADSKRLKAFLLAALVWLPLCFIGWAVFAAWLDYVPAKLAGVALTHGWPGLFKSIVYHGSSLEVGSTLMVPQGGQVGQLIFSLDPMMYGYGLPLYAALAMATPLTAWQRVQQCVVVGLLVWLVQIAGLVTGGLRLVAFETGTIGHTAAVANGLDPEWVALGYQFAYLILPAVLPAVAWVLLNRRFVEPLGRGNAELPHPASGLSED